MSLAPITRVWGGAEIRRGRPPVERVRDALFTPYDQNAAWGVFDRDGRVVEATVDRRFPEGATIEQEPVATAAYAEVRNTAPGAEYVYVGRVSSHFGHFLVETLPRYWSVAGGPKPRQKLLVHSLYAYNFFAGSTFAPTLFRALGVRPEHFFWSAEPIRVPDLTIPHPSLRQQAWAHPVYARMCRRIGRRLLAERRTPCETRPVWLSKSKLPMGVSRFVNEDRLEAVLAAAGVEIVHPETLPLVEQLRLFAERRAVLGTTGSAFHLAAFAPPGARLIGLGWENAVNSNFVLFDRLGGLDMVRVYAPDTAVARGTHPFLIEATLADPEGVARALLRLI